MENITAQKNTEEIQSKIINHNKETIKEISSTIAEVNKKYFKEKLLSNLTEEQLKYIHTSENRLIDDQGRATQQYVKIADEILPIYQPGTICFNSAIKKESNYVVDHNGQQNGIILGNGCALFLSKVSFEISKTYNNQCNDSNLNCDEMNKLQFNKSIVDTLNKQTDEDMNEHGRLVEIINLLGQMYGNNNKNNLFNIIYKPYIQKNIDLNKIKSSRLKDSEFDGNNLINGKDLIDKETLNKIKQALLVKNGLVDNDTELQDFRKNIDLNISNIMENKTNNNNNQQNQLKYINFNLILITSNKSYKAYFIAAIKLFEGVEEKPPVDKITLSGLGFAIQNTSLAAEQLHRNLFATIVSITSDLVCINKNKQKSIPRLTIILQKDMRNFSESLNKYRNDIKTKNLQY